MLREFDPGDFLVYQLESGFALLRLLGVDDAEGGSVWHLAGYQDLYPDVDTAVDTIDAGADLRVSESHMALTDRAFESTQVAKIGHRELRDDELGALGEWRASGERHVSDRSVRLLLGLR